jgi:hypothetical protein
MPASRPLPSSAAYRPLSVGLVRAIHRAALAVVAAAIVAGVVTGLAAASRRLVSSGSGRTLLDPTPSTGGDVRISGKRRRVRRVPNEDYLLAPRDHRQRLVGGLVWMGG